jgi:hypothetical protein
MLKISEGKTGPHFRLSGMPSMPVMPRQRIASRSFGAMSERIQNARNLDLVIQFGKMAVIH